MGMGGGSCPHLGQWQVGGSEDSTEAARSCGHDADISGKLA